MSRVIRTKMRLLAMKHGLVYERRELNAVFEEKELEEEVTRRTMAVKARHLKAMLYWLEQRRARQAAGAALRLWYQETYSVDGRDRFDMRAVGEAMQAYQE